MELMQENFKVAHIQGQASMAEYCQVMQLQQIR